MTKEERLVKVDFCREKGIPVVTQLELQSQGMTRSGDTVFLIFGPTVQAVRYTVPRYDTTPLTNYPGLSLDAEFKLDPALINREMIAAWVNRKINVDMLPSDIGKILIKGDKVSVVISSNSMRFKHSFSMAFK